MLAVYHCFIGLDVLFSPCQERIWQIFRVRTMILRRKCRDHRCLCKFTFEFNTSHSLCPIDVLCLLYPVLPLVLSPILLLLHFLIAGLLGRRCGAQSHS